MRKNFGVKTWLFPMPVLILGTYDENGRPNAMNAAWGGIWDTNQVMVCLGSHQTTDNIRKNKALTISFATADTVAASDYVGLVSQKEDPEKMKKAGLIPERASKVNAPIFTNYPLAIECEVVEILNDDNAGGNVVANIVNVSADERILTDGKIDYKKARFLVFDPVAHKYVEMGEEVAEAFKVGLKLK